MFDKLLKSVVAVALMPVTIVADCVTLGGVLVDEDETFTGRAVKAAAKNFTEALED